ncbi:MAG: hypothetical protein WBE58_16460, partial [Verrucomicrobiales bacterium]
MVRILHRQDAGATGISRAGDFAPVVVGDCDRLWGAVAIEGGTGLGDLGAPTEAVVVVNVTREDQGLPGPRARLGEAHIPHLRDEIALWFAGGFHPMDGARHLRQQGGVVLSILIPELPGKAFHARELVM